MDETELTTEVSFSTSNNIDHPPTNVLDGYVPCTLRLSPFQHTRVTTDTKLCTQIIKCYD